MKTNDDELVNETFENLKPDEPDWANNDVIFITHARLQIWAHKKVIPDNVIVVYDDAAYKSWTRLEYFKEQFQDAEYAGSKLTVIEKHGKKFFVKPDVFMPLAGIQNKVILSTTEIVTKDLILKEIGAETFVPELMESKLTVGDITLFKTKLVYSKFDSLLLPISERLKKMGFDHCMIADGIGAVLNHVTCKGRNDVKATDILAKISQPHYNEVFNVKREFDDEYPAQLHLSLDKLHQAVGRNSGYRWHDASKTDRRSAVVLCDPTLFNRLNEDSRYEFGVVEDLITLPKDGSHRRRDRSTFQNALAYLIQNFDKYVNDEIPGLKEKGMFKKDCKEALKSNKAKTDELIEEWKKALETLAKEKEFKHMNQKFNALKHELTTI